MTLIEIIVVVGVSMVLTVAVMDQMRFMQSSVNHSRLRLAVQDIALELRNVVTIGNSVFESLPSNPGLASCVNGGVIDGCNPSGIGVGPQIDLTLIQPATGETVAGPSTAPVFYNMDGAICSAGTACPLRVVATWRGDCPVTPGPVEGPCERATRIEISYRIDLNPAWNNEGSPIRPIDFTVIRPVESILTGVLSCPVGQVLRGFNFDGSLICESP